MIITIEGKQGEGKTRTAHWISQNNISTFVTQDLFKTPKWKSSIVLNTKYIVIDEIYDYLKMYLFVRNYINRVPDAPHFVLIRQTTTTNVFSNAETMV